MATTTRQSAAELFEREMREVRNEDRLEVVDELYAPEVESGTTRAGAGTGTLGDPEAIESMLAEWDAAFPDMEIEVTTVMEDGDAMMAVREARGPTRGPSGGSSRPGGRSTSAASPTAGPRPGGIVAFGTDDTLRTGPFPPSVSKDFQTLL